MIQDKGRLGWQKAVGYGWRSLGETAMFRYKTGIALGWWTPMMLSHEVFFHAQNSSSLCAGISAPDD
jgi:hypothetical protein